MTHRVAVIAGGGVWVETSEEVPDPFVMRI
jgi:hypothetical protein